MRTDRLASLFAKNFFHLSDFLLNLAPEFFVGSLGFEVGFLECATDFLFDRAFHLVRSALDLILRAVFHLDLLTRGTQARDRPNHPQANLKCMALKANLRLVTGFTCERGKRGTGWGMTLAAWMVPGPAKSA